MTGFVPLAPDDAVHTLVRIALAEDVASGDRTTAWTVPPGARGEARVVARAPLVVAGMRPCRAVFEAVDGSVEVHVRCGDGARVAPGDVVLTASGSLASILAAERTALNFLQRLSGIATLTAAFVDAAAGTGARIVDTRKTTPGWRHLEKAAVRAGGGHNHRMGLWDMILIKENHVAAAGGIEAAVQGVASRNDEGMPVQVEVRDLDEFDEALRVPVDFIMLDNMSLADMAEAVERARALEGARPALEASGNVTLARVREIAATGVDRISVGALTHSAPAADLSLLVDPISGDTR